MAKRFLTNLGAAALCAGLLLASSALAQNTSSISPPAVAQKDGAFAPLERWFEAQKAAWNSAVAQLNAGVRNFGREATIAAETGASGAKQAAEKVGKIRNVRVATGHAECKVAANGAPDCEPAATALCKAQGLQSGKSLDMTTAEDCPAKVYLSGRGSGAECKTLTFVSRALCQ